ncbi:AI-2E family transporter [Gemmata sp.]|uniref:AI-2E family transporter n=1 Tax=Gemmata sp. TaxID=1914242 RepID=UPI003F71C47F
MPANDWQRAVVTLSATVVAVVVVVALYVARSVFIPIALSIFLAFILGPVVTRLHRRGLNRTLAVILTVGFVVVGTVGVGALVARQVVHLAQTLPDRAEAIKEKVARAKAWVGGDGTNRFGDFITEMSELVAPKAEGQQAVMVEPGANSSIGTRFDVYISPVAEFLGQAAFAFVLTVYMLLRREDLRNRIIRLLGAGKITTTTKAADEASRRISRYLFMQLLLNSGFGLIVTVGLFAMSVDYALLWGFVAAVMRYVPYVGTIAGLVPPVLYSFATSTGLAQPVGVLVLYVSLEVVCNNVFEPWLYGASMGLSEVAQLVAAAFWAFLWGPLGLILSGPLTTCLLVLGKYASRFEFLDVLLGDEPALAPHVAFYQRLAARDQDEAADVALKVAAEHGPDAAFDSVVIPALFMARRDAADGDLDDAALKAIVRGVREVAGEVADLRPVVARTGDATRVRALVVPARDEAEHVAADLLAGSLDPAVWDVRVPGDEMLASELVEQVEAFQPAVVVLVSLPPGGMSHTRYLVNRLRTRHPEVKLVVARLGEVDDPKPGADPVEGIKGADGVGRTLVEAQKRLAEMAPILAAAAAKDEKAAGEPVLVGTLSA